MHSLGGGSHEHDHEGAVWLGFTAAAAMLGFFFFEKLVSAVGGWREGRARSRETEQAGEEERKLRVVREGHVASDRAIGEKVCKHKYSTYCAADFEPGLPPSSSTTSPSCARAAAPAPRPAYTVCPAGGEPDGQATASDHDTVIISEHEVAHHGHSHAHSHLHSAPESISSVAWMVIFGDGIHNLADGLAIGAAFAEGAMSGFSTSVAVLCHELPHEIGEAVPGFSLERAGNIIQLSNQTFSQ
jgi:zinc transporter ZupT